MNPDPNTRSALSGILVVDESQGPMAGLTTMVLSDFGAQVIKLEPPAGDPWRSMASAPLWLRGKRSAVLDAMSVTRAGPADWERSAIQTLTLAQDAWRIDVSHLIPVEAAPVWRFFRDGDKALLQDTLTHQPDWPHAAELQATLDGLVEQAGHINPGRIESLLPGLQSECATPQSLDELRAACNRALERWANRVNELDTLDDLNAELAFQGYPDSFKIARRAQRKVTLFVGPPNSGKTHQAFDGARRALFLAHR